jgi:hypothetical protein
MYWFDRTTLGGFRYYLWRPPNLTWGYGDRHNCLLNIFS